MTSSQQEQIERKTNERFIENVSGFLVFLVVLMKSDECAGFPKRSELNQQFLSRQLSVSCVGGIRKYFLGRRLFVCVCVCGVCVWCFCVCVEGGGVCVVSGRCVCVVAVVCVWW